MSRPGVPWVYVVDDDHRVLVAFQRLLESAGYNVASFDSPRAFLAAHDPALPGCALLDVGMTEISGLETQQELLSLGNARPIIFVTGHDDVPTTVLAMKGGARDYLLKPVADTVLLAAVENAISADVASWHERTEVAALMRRLQSLTHREYEVMEHVVRGRLNKQIAGDLDIVEKTVKVHRARVMGKMGVRSVAELVRIFEQLKRIGYMRDAGS